jgi:inosine-uridine nucleoside N-ribohydrolase
MGLFLVTCKDGKKQEFSVDTGKKQVIVDTDMGLDDMRAIIALLADTSTTVRGFVVNTGSADRGAGADNLIGMLESHHVENIPVFRGVEAPGAKKPEWRELANTLAGRKFPPPRELETAQLPADWYDDVPAADILALGPLTSLALQLDHSGRLHSDTCRIWIPVTLDGRNFQEWNLGFDADAARKVFSQAGAIILVDVPALPAPEDNTLITGLPPTNPGARWIRDIAASGDTMSDHRRLFDEFAVAALLAPELTTADDQTYRAEINPDGTGMLVPQAGGNVRLVSFRERSQAAVRLAHLWEHGPVGDHAGLRGMQIPVEKYLGTFHGHLGPYVVLGYRMGQTALEQLDSDGHFDLKAEVHSILKPPFSCLIDGVQLGSGCTLGKRNIMIEAETGPAWARFTSNDGKIVTIRLRPEIPEKVTALVNTRGVESAAQEMLALDPEQVFIIEK